MAALAGQHHAQAWLNRRFAMLKPEDFEGAVHFCCMSALEPPQSFRQMWTTCTGDENFWYLPIEDVSTLHAIVILSSPIDNEQLDGVCRLVQAIDDLGHDAPPILWVPHTAAPEVGLENAAVDITDPVRGGIFSHLLNMGLDAIVSDEPEGFKLALAVRSKIRKLASQSRTLNDAVNERRGRAQYVEYIKECVDCMLWDYLRIRLAPSIPPVDYDIPHGNIRHLDGFDFGNLLGRGMFGSVYRLLPQEDDAPQREQPQVIKVVQKEGVRELSGLKGMRSQIDVMNLLAAEQWRHPNLVRVYETYHSTSHLFFRMEFGGPENLYRRLNHRQKEGDTQRPLSLGKVGALITQAIDVLTHLHLGPKVCHRDLKPENFIVQDVPNALLVLKLADFDVALIQEGTGMAHSLCGTVPFTAPEVLLKREYSGMTADIWSLGVVLLEVLCGIRVVEQTLSLQQPGQAGGGQHHPDESIARKILTGFTSPGSAGNILRQRCRPELRSLLACMTRLLDGMLTVDTSQRFKAHQVREYWGQQTVLKE